eukprot:scaffold143629_cov44-Prasinocladus_malaysianus.AAC.1
MAACTRPADLYFEERATERRIRPLRSRDCCRKRCFPSYDSTDKQPDGRCFRIATPAKRSTRRHACHFPGRSRRPADFPQTILQSLYVRGAQASN